MKNQTIRNRFIAIISILLTTLLLLQSKLLAQNSYTFFESFEKNNPDSTGKFYFAIDNLNFFKNNEYKSNVAEGYTLTGLWLRPKAVYYPDKKLRIELGGNILKYNGYDDYSNISPWFSAIYLPNPNLTIILGNLDNDRLHGLIEPVADVENYFTKKPESGIQAKFNHKKVKLDTWIDWQQMILAGDPFQEKFAFGMKADFSILNNDNINIALPISFTGEHFGGEIDESSSPANTYSATTIGFVGKHFTKGELINEIGGGVHFSVSTYPESNPLPNLSGSGVYLNSYLNSKFGKLALSYWNSHEYFVPLGTPLYQNASNQNGNITDNNGLLNVQYCFSKRIFGSSHFGFVFDYYYDLARNKTSNSAGLYLNINFDVLTRKIK